MLLDTQKTEVVGSGEVETGTFNIMASAKTFMILSSQLYKYKIRAIIREVCCNAVDGHNAASKSGLSDVRQFDVHLPTTLEPEFRCRDYGIGLSHEDMMTMYSTYFASTKSGSNTDIGGFGLGCKSPFCYSDTFCVTSWFNGRKRTYTAYMQDGIPNISLLTDDDQGDEPNGVEVVIPTEGTDNRDWYNEAEYVFSTFDINGYTPNMVGYRLNFRFVNDYNSVGMSLDNRTLHPNGFYAVMGGVAYPIPPEFYKDTYLSVFTGATNFIKFEIGDLDMQPSREELFLDSKTKEVLKDRISGVVGHLMTEIMVIADGCMDVRELYRKMQDKPGIVWDRQLDGYTIQGKTVKEWKHNLFNFNSAMPYPKLGLSSISMNRDGVLRRSQITGNKSDPTGRRLRSIAEVSRTVMPYIILNDMKTGFGEILRGLHELKYINLTIDRKPVYIANISDDTPMTDSNGDQTTLGKMHHDNIKYFMSLWHQQYKSGGVFLLSKWKDRVRQECAAKNIVIQSAKSVRSKDKPIMVETYSFDALTGNVKSDTVKLFASDIADLKDGYWIVQGRNHLYPAGMETKTVTKKDGTTDERFARMYESNGSIASTSLLHDLAMVTKKTVYICRLAQSKHFYMNQNLMSAYHSIPDLAEQMLSTITVDDLPGTYTPRFVQRLLGHHKTVHLGKVLQSNTPANHDKLSLINNYSSDFRPTVGLSARKADLMHKLTVMKDQVNNVSQTRYDKFKKENPLVYSALESGYRLSDEVSEDILSFVRV